MMKYAILAAVVALLWAAYQRNRLITNSSVLAEQRQTPRKPAHCRSQLPGCVPLDIHYVYLLHVPKAAGSSVHHFLYGNSPYHRTSKYTYRKCPIVENGFMEYHCHARRGWLRNRTDGERVCAGQHATLTELFSGNVFDRLQCSTLVGHYDMGLYDALPQKIREKTLVVTTLREPVELMVSLFHFLPKAHRFCTNHESCSLLFEHGVENMTITGFAAGEGGLGIDAKDGVTKMLAGDYCCYNQGPPLMTQKRRLTAALDALDTKIGVVVSQSRVEDSLKYLAYVLGWIGANTAYKINVNAHPTDMPRGILHELESLAGTDVKLFKYGMERVKAQMMAMNE